MALFFYFNKLSSWNELFQRDLGFFVTLVEIPEELGGGVISSLQKWKIHGGPKWNSLRGGGLNIFWNHNIKNNDTTDSKERISLTQI